MESHIRQGKRNDNEQYRNQARDSKLRRTAAQAACFLLKDNAADAALVVRALCKDGFDVTADVVQDEAGFTQALRTNAPEIVLADYNLPNWTGMEALKVLRSEGHDIPMSSLGRSGDVTAVECIKQGATDYVLKDGLARLPEVIRRALREKNERDLRRKMEDDLDRKVDELARSNADLEHVRLCSLARLAGTSAHGDCLYPATGGTLSRQTRRDADKFIGYAVEGAQRMQVLIKDLLAFSKIGRDSAASGSVDCNAVIAEVVLALDTTIQESGATVTHEKLPAVWADRTQVAQVFQNLISNAIKFRGIKSPVISAQAEKADQLWQFSVSDNGIGIAPEYAENIFVVFQRLHARSEYAGNGIGLAICKKIVERYGGRIWVESQTGSGSTFKFTLPGHGPDGKEETQP